MPPKPDQSCTLSTPAEQYRLGNSGLQSQHYRPDRNEALVQTRLVQRVNDNHFPAAVESLKPACLISPSRDEPCIPLLVVSPPDVKMGERFKAPRTTDSLWKHGGRLLLMQMGPQVQGRTQPRQSSAPAQAHSNLSRGGPHKQRYAHPPLGVRPAVVPNPNDLATLLVPNTGRAVRPKPAPSLSIPVPTMNSKFSEMSEESPLAPTTSIWQDEELFQVPPQSTVTANALSNRGSLRPRSDAPALHRNGQRPNHHVHFIVEAHKLDPSFDSPSYHIHQRPIQVGATARSIFKENDTNPSEHVEKIGGACIVNTSKALPPLRSDLLSANDRIGEMTLQLESLAYRRVNMIKGIQQMTDLSPPDSFLMSSEDSKKRTTDAQKLEQIRQELTQVQKEEYELALKLHRALKRQDREEGRFSSSLWVRRATR